MYCADVTVQNEDAADAEYVLGVRLAPYALAILLYTLFLIPEEASLFLAGLRLPLYRIVLLIIVPIGLLRFVWMVVRPRYSFVWSDVLFLAAALWMVVSVWVTEGQNSAIVKGGVAALEFSGTYIVVRAFLTQRGQVLALAGLLGRLIAVVGLLGMLDMACGYYVIHQTVSSFTGYAVSAQEPRFGLIRASGTLEHPILLGTVCAFAILLGMTPGLSRRWFIIGGATLGLLASVSSGPIGAAFIGIACLIYRKIMLRFEARWALLMLSAAIPFVLFILIHPTPFSSLAGHLSFDKGSANYRLVIWNVAGQLVLNSPIFGIGPSDWVRPDWMPSTVDSIWLKSAMDYGIPGSLLIAASLAGACSRRVDNSRARLTVEERHLGATLSIIMFLYIYVGFVVHFWGVTWTLMGLLAGMRAHIGALAQEESE
jgi:O-antigen ligase